MLTSFGIDPVAEAVYLAMVNKPEATVGEIAEAIGGDELAVRRALDQLADRALVAQPSEFGAVVLVHPEAALPALLAEQQAEAAQLQFRIEEGRRAIAQVLARYGGQQASSDPDVQRLTGSTAVREKVAELAAESNSEVLSLSPVGTLTPTAAAAARPVDEEILRRGVRLRKIYLDSVRNDGFTIGELRREVELGGEVRTLPSLPLRMIVIDQTHGVIPISNQHCGAGGLILTGDVMVRALTALFAGLWRDAQPLSRPRPHRQGDINLQEKHVLSLWAQGYTDAMAARRMGVSMRTVRRLSDKLTNRLNAQSRFQLGALAVSRGWIHPDELS